MLNEEMGYFFLSVRRFALTRFLRARRQWDPVIQLGPIGRT